jgi:sulfite reductase beta subunit-like hemoprotein
MSVEQDQCPGVLRLHAAEDGLLARVRLPGGRITPAQLEAVAVAGALGNGVIELTSRASLQIRGLSDGAVSGVLADAGLLPSASHERVRNILASPVAGRHPLSVWNPDATVAELDAALCGDPALAGLSGRFLFGVEDGTGLLGHPVDVVIGPGGTVDAALAAAHRALVGEPPAGSPPAPPPAAAPPLAAPSGPGRAAALRVSGSWRVRAAGTTAQLALGPLTQRDGHVALTVMPRLGRLDPDSARALAALGHELRLSTYRTLTLLDLAPAAAAALERELVALGLITDPRSGWVGLSACAGLGACHRAELDVRARATQRATERGPGATPEHWAACARSCGLTPGAQLMGAMGAPT